MSSSAFSQYSSADRLEKTSLPPAAAAFRPLLAATRGLAAAGSAQGMAPPASAAAVLTLPDGRLHVGTHLPLLAQRYKYLSTLGEGVSAQVILAEDTLAPTPGCLVAIKAMRRQHALAGQREARALRYLHAAAPGGAAPGVVRLLDSFMLGAHYCLVTERLYPWLLDWIAESSGLPPAAALRQLRKLAHQLLVTVAFQHNCGLVHSDIKPDNLLLVHPPGSRSVALRLADFGACFSLTETDTLAVGCEVQTLPYRAPEAALGLPYGAAIDLWSVGVILAEVALKRALLPCTTPRDLLHQMAALLGPLPEAMLRTSPLAQHTDLSALWSTTPGGAAATDGRATLPAELEQRAAAAAAAGVRSAPLRAPCALHVELAAVDADLADLVLRLLAYDPTQRITAHEALLHGFFDAACPLRAVFPQLQELCQLQQAALQSESAAVRAAAAAAAEPHGQPAAAAADATALHVKPLSRSPTPLPGMPPSAAAVAAAAAAEAAAAESLRRRQHAQSPPAHQPAGQPLAAVRATPVNGQQQQQARTSALQSQASRAKPWRALSVALAQPQAPQSRLPAAQLAAQAAQEQRRLAAATPYAGSFSPHFQATPAKPTDEHQEEQSLRQQQPQQPSPLGKPAAKEVQAAAGAAAEAPLAPQRQQPKERQKPASAAKPTPGRSKPALQAQAGAASAAGGLQRKVGPVGAAGDAAPRSAAPKSAHKAAARGSRGAASAKKPQRPRQAQQQPRAGEKRALASALAAAAQLEQEQEDARPFSLLLEAVAVEEGEQQAAAAGAAAGKSKRVRTKPQKQPQEGAGAAPRSAAKPMPGKAAGGGAPAKPRQPQASVAASNAKSPAGAAAAATPAAAAAAPKPPPRPASAPPAAKPRPAAAEASSPAVASPAATGKAASALKRGRETPDPPSGEAADALVPAETAKKRPRARGGSDAKPWWCV